MKEHFARVAPAFCGCLLALIGMRIWDGYGWRLIIGAAAAFTVVLVLAKIKGTWDGNRGLDQWPDPHGRLYDEWLSIPSDQGNGDYYEWLSRKMGHKQPWASWAAREKKLQASRRDTSA